MQVSLMQVSLMQVSLMQVSLMAGHQGVQASQGRTGLPVMVR
jgi:hypothetical protein